LNVLDYDYYFKLTDYFLTEQIAESLLIFDQVLDNGFDAHHFVAGIAGHFRDLMVCKNPETVKLLEVGAGIKQKYLEQAQKCNIDFLYSGLTIASKCDIEYKSSSNKRLHIELALIELCYITTNQKKKNNELIQQNLNPQTQEKQEVIEQDKNTTSINPQVAVRKTTVNKVTSMPSLRQAKEGIISEQKIDSKPNLVDFELVNSTANEPFTLEQVQSAFKLFAEKIINNKARIANALNTPQLQINGNKIHLFSPNLTLKEEIGLIHSDLIGFIKSELKNAQIEIILEVKSISSQKPIFTQSEKFAYLIEKNSALQDLKEVFKLDF
jgi:DNA polymerase-3 subunit gamma/tau